MPRWCSTGRSSSMPSVSTRFAPRSASRSAHSRRAVSVSISPAPGRRTTSWATPTAPPRCGPREVAMTDAGGRNDALEEIYEPEQLILSDLINRVLDKGVVISSNITISIADIDLIQLDLRLLLSSVAALTDQARRRRAEAARRDDVSVRSDPRA